MAGIYQNRHIRRSRLFNSRVYRGNFRRGIEQNRIVSQTSYHFAFFTARINLPADSEDSYGC